jgi:hypothetical protein
MRKPMNRQQSFIRPPFIPGAPLSSLAPGPDPRDREAFYAEVEQENDPAYHRQSLLRDLDEGVVDAAGQEHDDAKRDALAGLFGQVESWRHFGEPLPQAEQGELKRQVARNLLAAAPALSLHPDDLGFPSPHSDADLEIMSQAHDEHQDWLARRAAEPGQRPWDENPGGRGPSGGEDGLGRAVRELGQQWEALLRQAVAPAPSGPAPSGPAAPGPWSEAPARSGDGRWPMDEKPVDDPIGPAADRPARTLAQTLERLLGDGQPGGPSVLDNASDPGVSSILPGEHDLRAPKRPPLREGDAAKISEPELENAEEGQPMTYWVVEPEPGACDKCLALSVVVHDQEPTRPHPNCKCEIAQRALTTRQKRDFESKAAKNAKEIRLKRDYVDEREWKKDGDRIKIKGKNRRGGAEHGEFPGYSLPNETRGGVKITYGKATPEGPTADPRVREETRDAVQEILDDPRVKAAGVKSVNISCTTNGAHEEGSTHYDGRAVDISRINGKTLDDPEARKQAEIIQEVAKEKQGEGKVGQNFGPAMQKEIRNGATIEVKQQEEEHKLHIHISTPVSKQ